MRSEIFFFYCPDFIFNKVILIIWITVRKRPSRQTIINPTGSRGKEEEPTKTTSSVRCIKSAKCLGEVYFAFEHTLLLTEHCLSCVQKPKSFWFAFDF